MVFYIDGPVINTNCFCRKNKTNGINLQCPFKKKFGDFCGRHKNDNKWRIRIDEPTESPNQCIPINDSVKVLITEKDYLEDYDFDNFNYKSIRWSCKKYGLPTSSNRILMCYNLADFFENIISYKKHENQIRLIQRNFRKYLKNRDEILRGPALHNRKLCNNAEDFLSFEPIENISNDKFFSYVDKDKFIYGFDVKSFDKLIENKMDNPYNRNPIPNRAIKNIKTLVKLSKNNMEAEMENYTPKQKINHRVMKIFQEIDRIGVYAGGTDIKWFHELNANGLKTYYKTLEDIWNYRANLTNVQKSQIAPYQTMFPYSVYNFNKINSLNKMKNVLLTEMEKLVFSADEDSNRSLGCYYILIAFVEINPVCAALMPWLVQA